ncbi:MAG TPA: DUF6531 domain-containing protein, partial [Polyangia bacterium]
MDSPEAACDQCAGDPVDVASGVYHTSSTTDVRLVGAYGDDLGVRRQYSSGARGVAQLPLDPATDGRGISFVGSRWSHNYQTRIVDQRPQGGGIGLVVEDGRWLQFTLSGSMWSPPPGNSAVLEVLGANAGVSDCDMAYPGGFKVTLRDGRAFFYNASGRFARWQNAVGKGVCAGYDAAGRLKYLRNDSRQAVAFEYYLAPEQHGQAGELKALHLADTSGNPKPGKRVVTYEYDATQLTAARREAWVATGEDDSYQYGGGSNQDLLTRVARGEGATEKVTYCAQATAGCGATGSPDQVQALRSATAALTFEYGSWSGCGAVMPAGTTSA